MLFQTHTCSFFISWKKIQFVSTIAQSKKQNVLELSSDGRYGTAPQLLPQMFWNVVMMSFGLMPGSRRRHGHVLRRRVQRHQRQRLLLLRATDGDRAAEKKSGARNTSGWWGSGFFNRIGDPEIKHFWRFGCAIKISQLWKREFSFFSTTVEVSVIVGHKFRRFKNEFPVASPFPFKQQQHLGWSFDVGHWQWQWHGGLFPKFQKQHSSFQICP